MSKSLLHDLRGSSGLRMLFFMAVLVLSIMGAKRLTKQVAGEAGAKTGIGFSAATEAVRSLTAEIK